MGMRALFRRGELLHRGMNKFLAKRWMWWQPAFNDRHLWSGDSKALLLIGPVGVCDHPLGVSLSKAKVGP